MVVLLFVFEMQVYNFFYKNINSFKNILKSISLYLYLCEYDAKTVVIRNLIMVYWSLSQAILILLAAFLRFSSEVA
jgi:hypothetical protein